MSHGLERTVEGAEPLEKWWEPYSAQKLEVERLAKWNLKQQHWVNASARGVAMKCEHAYLGVALKIQVSGPTPSQISTLRADSKYICIIICNLRILASRSTCSVSLMAALNASVLLINSVMS